MVARSVASLSLTFGLVSVPIRLYSATESSSAIKFKLMAPDGARVRQTYVADALPAETPEPEPISTPSRVPARAKASSHGGNSSVVHMPPRTPPLSRPRQRSRPSNSRPPSRDSTC